MKPLIFVVLGFVGIFIGIALMDVNFYLGVIVIGVAAITASWFKKEAMQVILKKAQSK